jgi:hypothetical protein
MNRASECQTSFDDLKPFSFVVDIEKHSNFDVQPIENLKAQEQMNT